MSPGPAITFGRYDDDFTLPAAIYHDSIAFYVLAVKHAELGDCQASDRFNRAALSAIFSFYEALLNQIAFAYAEAHSDKLDQITRDVLEEKETRINEKGEVARYTKFYLTEARLSYLSLFLTGKDVNRADQVWKNYRDARALRDKWVHPKPPVQYLGA